jgi:hypothetical protein
MIPQIDGKGFGGIFDGEAENRDQTGNIKNAHAF